MGKEILCSAPTPTEAAKDLLSRLESDDKAVIITLCGKDGTSEQAEEISDFIRDRFPMLEGYAIDGKQDVYPFIFILQ